MSGKQIKEKDIYLDKDADAPQGDTIRSSNDDVTVGVTHAHGINVGNLALELDSERDDARAHLSLELLEILGSDEPRLLGDGDAKGLVESREVRRWFEGSAVCRSGFYLGLDNGHGTGASRLSGQGDALTADVERSVSNVELDVELDVRQSAQKELVCVAVIQEIIGSVVDRKLGGEGIEGLN
jgi:hypothetical protein